MIDVARLAGVSHQSVSRVVNGSGGVSPEIRERVERAVAQLRYRRHPAARALATNRTFSIGVVSFGLAQYGPSEALAGIAREAQEAGYSTSLTSLLDVDVESMAEAVGHLIDDSVDGIIVLAPVDAALTAMEGVDVDVPLVLFYPGAHAHEQRVVTDEVRGAELATAHLLDLGHPTVHHISGPEGWLGTSARIAGWRLALQARGIEPPATVEGDWTAAGGAGCAEQLSVVPDVSAVFAANDQMALGAMKAFNAAGLSVPDDISVVGFDDIPGSEYFRPPLTTVRFDFAEVGRRAAHHIFELIAGARPDPARPVVPDLIVRDSARHRPLAVI
ncbi:LacI family DNA-binding transcriptional regulator [Microbacterium sp. ZXX196]|nr:LacI family DNA-binding transcriptional regulator [Microbacterium sp. ZXX196]